jgi:hypothetical protein
VGAGIGAGMAGITRDSWLMGAKKERMNLRNDMANSFAIGDDIVPKLATNYPILLIVLFKYREKNSPLRG